MATIPKSLKKIAADLDCNVINYITTTTEGEIFSLAKTDSYGNYLPIGMPILYACVGELAKQLTEDRASEILRNIPE